MVGVILILIALLVVLPIGIMMSGAALSALIGWFVKESVDGDFIGTDDLALSQANPYGNSGRSSRS